MKQRIILKDAQATQAIATKIANMVAKKPMLIFIYGEVGAGKTCFVQRFIQTLLPHENVPSPTYAYVHDYQFTVPIYHLDLYRIDDPASISHLGLLDILDDEHTIRLVEWPQCLQGITRNADVQLELSIIPNGRLLEITGLNSPIIIDTDEFEC